ncbi:hypothetical protein KUTeg_005043 [Tegillarca granosa]|uniref:Uncharacterized protein n=1 Tax=Tegillarca granosa TaxID=220873 RepID=A0ABQ9FIM8_TEGGR|nr:hypothetical protein KUTeg_005043 [Tegillarca granosa]
MAGSEKENSHSSVKESVSTRIEFMPWKWLRRRETGHSNVHRGGFSESEMLNTALYSNFKALHTWDPSKTVQDTHHGGIFNFDFSTDGSLMAAACEGHSILMFDPFNGKLVSSKSKAHNDCVNCVRFLDSRIFASCSDDQTVALWDARYMKNKLHHLKGHSNWVKNIEYIPEKGVLLTSGFDGNIFTWDINSYSESEIQGKKVFHTNRLMRSKLTPDNKKLIISTQNGCIIIIHNLDLSTLADDLSGFKMSRIHHFSKRSSKRNKVEVISDWPTGNHAKVVASLQVHPYGWCVLSRNMSNQDVSEWTCVHDIQEYDGENKDDEETKYSGASDASMSTPVSGASALRCSSHLSDVQTASTSSLEHVEPLLTNASGSCQHFGQDHHDSLSMNNDFRNHSIQNGHAHVQQNGHIIDLFSFSDTSSDSDSSDSSDSGPGIHIVYHSNRTNGPMAASSGSQDGTQGQAPSQGNSSSNSDNSNSNNSQNREFIRISSTLNLDAPLDRNDVLTLIIQSGERRRVVNLNYRDSIHVEERPVANGISSTKYNSKDRLLYYTEEPNVGKGFIKELCFSSDGRIICSPFGFGVRLLSFDPHCRELCDCVPTSPVQLYEVGSCMSHANVVVTSKFSPNYCMLVSGCFNGRVVFHQPVL